MKKILVGHHSVSDWDFQLGPTYRSLSATHFVSAPTALKLMNTGAGSAFDMALCRIPTTQCLPQGELWCWRWSTNGSGRFFTFRNQRALGSADSVNCYIIFFTSTQAQLYRNVGGGSSLVGAVNVAYVPNAWAHWRVVWWNGENGAGVDALAVNFYKEIGGVWVQQGATIFDTVQQFKLSAVNRCGVSAQTQLNYADWFDDTIICGP